RASPGNVGRRRSGVRRRPLFSWKPKARSERCCKSESRRAQSRQFSTICRHSESQAQMKNDDRPRNHRKDTLLTHTGRNPEANFGVVNPPVYHASTILSKNMAEWEAK